MGKRTKIGAFLHSTWGNLNVRCANGKYHRDTLKNKCYKDININLTREELKNIILKNKEIILSLKRPSIDRIDKTKHYTTDNIQFIELSENIGKDRTVFKNGKGICYRCKKQKPIEEFVKDLRRKNKKTSVCKICEKERCYVRNKNYKLNARS